MFVFILERRLSNVADVELIVLFGQLWFDNEYMHIHGGERPLKYDVYTYSAISRNLKYNLCSLAAEKAFQV